MAANKPSARFSHRLQRVLARAVLSLPPSLQVRLSGKPAVQIDGQTLAPQVQLGLAIMARRGEPQPETMSPVEARRLRRELAAVYAGKPAAVGPVTDLEIDADPRIPARHYVPSEPGPHPLLVFFHGGGFLFGDLDTHDAVCRLLCRHSGAQVLAVDYRLAPENPFPAAVEDARAALAWAHANATRLGADARRVGVGGDSAGGNLAAVVSQLAARDGGPAPALQMLIYPVTDFTRRRRSRELFGEGFFLTNAEMDWFSDSYLGAGEPRTSDTRVSPLLAEDLSGLAPALIFTAGFDPLRDDGEAYAEALAAAGTSVTLRRFPGFIHAFISTIGVDPACRDALIEIAGATRATFGAATPRPEAAPRLATPLSSPARG